MRYLKLAIFIIFLSVSVLFFVQNYEALSLTKSLKFDVFVVNPFISVPLPLYLLFIIFFVFGALISMLFLILDRIGLASQLRTCRKRMKSLEQEVNSLRNLPLQNTTYSGASTSSAPTAMDDDLSMDMNDNDDD